MLGFKVIQEINRDYRSTLINFANYPYIMFPMAKIMAMAAIQLGIPKRIVYVKNTNLDILNKRLTDEGKEETKDYNEAKVLINPEILSREGITT